MEDQDLLKLKVEQLMEEMKREGLWKRIEPDWIMHYPAGPPPREVDFFEWLQFVYLPNRALNKIHYLQDQSSYIMLQAKKYAGEKLMNEKIIQLLIEIDGLG